MENNVIRGTGKYASSVIDQFESVQKHQYDLNHSIVHRSRASVLWLALRRVHTTYYKAKTLTIISPTIADASAASTPRTERRAKAPPFNAPFTEPGVIDVVSAAEDVVIVTIEEGPRSALVTTVGVTSVG